MTHLPRFRSTSRRSALRALAGAALVTGLAVFSVDAGIAHEFKIGSIEIVHPWARATPAGAKVGGGYVVLKNDGAADRLVSATAEVAGRVEIHEMAMKDGVMTMRPLADGLPVPAHGEVALKPGSYHIMFMDLKAPLKQGESVKGSLTFEKAGTVDVTFKVEGIGASAPDHGSHSGH